MKIVFLDTKTLGNVPNLSKFSALGNVSFHETTTSHQTISHIADASVIVTNKVLISDDVMAACPALKLICISATGMNNVDLVAAASRGITVKNAVGYSTESVTQHTFAMLLSLLNRLDYYDQYVKNGGYSKSDIFTHYGPTVTELAGKVFGIIGLGNIGKSVAKVATAFGASVIYYSTTGKNINQEFESVSLNDLLKNSDVISIHAPLNDNTKNLISLNALKTMKKSSILINVGRGGIVNEEDLAQALNDDIIAGACADVFASEPILANNPLTFLKRPEKIVLSPHNAWASLEARIRLMEIVYKNIEEFLRDGR
jgi:lactate dehydrogenase-like 2-hydroxyacid dehydrogenase